MSFFTKLMNQSNEEIPIEESIKTQIMILFNNKLDIYWSYNSKNHTFEGAHEIFQEKYLSEDFLFKLAKVMEVFDNRLCNVQCNLIYQSIIPFLNINAKIKNTTTCLPTISINLNDI